MKLTMLGGGGFRVPMVYEAVATGLQVDEIALYRVDPVRLRTITAVVGGLGCDGAISKKGFPLQAGARWVIERTNSWHTRGFHTLAICTERRIHVIDAFARVPAFATS